MSTVKPGCDLWKSPKTGSPTTDIQRTNIGARCHCCQELLGVAELALQSVCRNLRQAHGSRLGTALNALTLVAPQQQKSQQGQQQQQRQRGKHGADGPGPGRRHGHAGAGFNAGSTHREPAFFKPSNHTRLRPSCLAWYMAASADFRMSIWLLSWLTAHARLAQQWCLRG